MDYVALSDQDDVWMPQKLIQAVKKMAKSDAHIYGSSLTIVDEKLDIIGFYTKTKLSAPRSLFENAVSGNTMVLDFSALQDIRRVMSSYDCSFVRVHDWFIYTTLIALAHIEYIDEQSYILYRQHGNNSLGYRRDTIAQIARNWFKMYRMFFLMSGQAVRHVRMLDQINNTTFQVTDAHRSFFDDVRARQVSFFARLKFVMSYRFHRKITAHTGYVVCFFFGKKWLQEIKKVAVIYS